MTVFEKVTEYFKSPIEPYPFQHDVLEEAKAFDKILLRLKGGGGKTYCSIWLSIYHTIENGAEQIICVVPAPLVTQWSIVWRAFGVNVCEYQGTPTERKVMDIVNADVLIVSKNIFRDEWEVKEKTGKLVWKRIKGEKKQVEQTRMIPGRLKIELLAPRVIIYDEMSDGLRKKGNKIWEAIDTFARKQKLITLSATPISNPGDAFGVLKILGSKAYPTVRSFELKHVAKRDFFNQVTEWDNLDLMRENLDSVSVTVPDSAYKELPPIVYDRIIYDLSKKHRRDYETLVEDRLLETENGLMDATETNNLFHLLQQYVTAPEGSINKTMLELLKTIYEEDESPLVIFGNYRVTNRAILDFFGDKIACGKWGDFSKGQQEQNLQDFYSGKKKILIGNPSSLGIGTDGIQNVCYRAAFAEVPVTSVLFEQCAWRIHRDGQGNPCVIRTLTARGTIQMQLYQACLKKDDLVGQVTAKKLSLRDAFKV